LITNGHELGTVPAEPVSTITQILPLGGDVILFGNVSYVDPMAWYRYDPTSKKVTVTALRETSPYSFDRRRRVARSSPRPRTGRKFP
jgi:prolyl oligopeptidase